MASEPFEQTFTIAALAAIWLPSAYEPRALSIEDVDIRFDEDSATLIVDNDVPNSDGLTYEVTSASPRITPDDLTGLADEVPQEIRDRFLALPDGFSPEVTTLAREIAAGASTPAQQALALQDHLRAFEYSLDAQAGHSENALEDFLFVRKVGYCEQFAGAFAAMARSIGLPARVAVGFTPGDEDPENAGLYTVRGEYAHAWPEVFIAGAGWVAYEPTPGRGMPNAEAYTGVREQQAAPSNPQGTVTAPPTTAPEEIPSGGPSTTFRDPDQNVNAGGSENDENKPDALPVRLVLKPLATVLPVVGGVVAGYLVLFPLGLLMWRRRRRRRATTPAAQIELAWLESVEEAAGVGFQQRPSDTFFERAHHLSAALPDAEAAAFTLAARLEGALYSAEGADEDDAATSWQAADEIGEAARAAMSRVQRVRRWIDPRTLVRDWRLGHTARQRRITLTARGDLEQERELVGSGDRG